MKNEPPGLRPVSVVFNSDFLEGGSASTTHGAEAGQESQEVAHLIAESLHRRGHQVEISSIDDQIGDIEPRGVVFNLVESLGGDPGRESEFPIWLESRKIRFTGNSARALELAHAKHHAREVLAACGVTIPMATVFGGPEFEVEQLARLEFPLFIKPALYDGSVGVDQGSIVHSLTELRQRLEWLMDRIPGPYLAETYLPGREFNVAVGPHSLGRYAAVTEIDFSGFSSNLAPIVTYDCKWVPDCPEAVACSKPVVRDANPRLHDELVRLAKLALRSIGANAYGRVDLRLSADGKPHVIDVNPNPDIHPEAGFAIATRSVGHSIDQLYAAIVADALLPARRITRPEVRIW